MVLQQLILKSPSELHLVEGTRLIKKISIVVGRNGIRPDKVEGDWATPAGQFPIGPIFGHQLKPTIPLKMDYLPIYSDTVAVDDPNSPYYNQIVRSTEVSGEQMALIPQYEWGAVIQYNVNPTIPGKGSAIFIHLWSDPPTPTAGCVAMGKEDLIDTLIWLDPKKKPVLVVSNAY